MSTPTLTGVLGTFHFMPVISPSITKLLAHTVHLSVKRKILVSTQNNIAEHTLPTILLTMPRCKPGSSLPPVRFYEEFHEPDA